MVFNGCFVSSGTDDSNFILPYQQNLEKNHNANLIDMATMKAVVFKGPKVVQVEERPIPQIKEPGDVICKVQDTALCGR